MSERYTSTWSDDDDRSFMFDNGKRIYASHAIAELNRLTAEVATLREAYKTLRMFIWSHWEIAYEDARQANVENDKDAEAEAMAKANLYNAIMCHPASRELDIDCGLLKPIALTTRGETP